MAVNPYGAVWVNDFGLPKVISAYARLPVTGGQLVVASGTGRDVVSSGADTLATTDIVVAGSDNIVSGTYFTGVALATAASGAPVAVAVEGVFILNCGSDTEGGIPIAPMGRDMIGPALTAFTVCGRSLTGATSGNWIVAHIK
jgi:hypothetical protein